jgi:DNA-binding MarR family transcriptional regulator
MTPPDPGKAGSRLHGDSALRRGRPDTRTEQLTQLVTRLREIQFCRGERPWLLLDLTMGQLKAMMLVVQSGGVRSRELADGLGIAPSAATPLVDRLVDQKLARREDDPEDRRIIWIRPTPKAQALHDQLLHTNQQVLAEVLDELPADMRPKVQESIRLLLESAERVLQRK